jgi:hypothetical protein
MMRPTRVGRIALLATMLSRSQIKMSMVVPIATRRSVHRHGCRVHDQRRSTQAAAAPEPIKPRAPVATVAAREPSEF